MEVVDIKSPIKWTGGKANEIKYFKKYIPNFDVYVEPFVGGGALFWCLQPENAVLSDINEHLINFYIVLKSNYDELYNYNQKHQHTPEYFKKMVCKINNNDFINNIEKASVFYYINKTCFSGKWRVNSKGEFNNTWGNYKKPTYKKLDEQYSLALQNAIIYNKDYKDILQKYKLKSNAFIFLDPPYLDCDTMYTADQQYYNIYDYISKYINECCCKVMLIVKYSEYIENLFQKFIIDEYNKNYCHNAKSNKQHKHLIVCNYKY